MSWLYLRGKNLVFRLYRVCVKEIFQKMKKSIDYVAMTCALLLLKLIKIE